MPDIYDILVYALCLVIVLHIYANSNLLLAIQCARNLNVSK